MPISVIASNFNGLRFLPRLIETIREQEHATTEIIIVDRQSTDGSRDYLEKIPDIRVVTEPAHTGLVAGYAAGAAVARHELLFFCNEDMWFDPLCLHLLEQQISLENSVGAADPWQWTYDGQRWIHGGTRFCRPDSWKSRFNILGPGRGFDYTVPLTTGDRVPFACAGAFLIHRDVYREIGGWDTSFFLDFEDVDLFLRAWQRGWHCVTVAEARVYHAVNASNVKTLKNGVSVSSRRYIAIRSNTAVIGLKYYSGVRLLWVWIGLLIPVIGDLIRLRWRKLSLGLQSIALTMRRVSAVRRFRRSNREWSDKRPGYQFFLQHDMTRS